MSAFSPTGDKSMWYNLRLHNPWGAAIRTEVAAYDATCASERQARRDLKKNYAAQLQEQMAANAEAKRLSTQRRKEEGSKIIQEAQQHLEAERQRKLEDTQRCCSARHPPSPPKSLREKKREQYEQHKATIEAQRKEEEEELSARREARERTVALGASLRRFGAQAQKDKKLARAARVEEERTLLRQWDESLARPDYQTFLRQHQRILPDIDPCAIGKKTAEEICAEERAETEQQVHQIEELEKEQLRQKKEQQAKIRADLLRQMDERRSARLCSTQKNVSLRQRLEDTTKASTVSAQAESARRQQRNHAYAEELRRQMDERCLRDVDDVLYPLKAANITPAPPLPCSPGRRRPASSRGAP